MCVEQAVSTLFVNVGNHRLSDQLQVKDFNDNALTIEKLLIYITKSYT